MSTSTLIARRLMGELLEVELVAADVAMLWNQPVSAEDLDSLRSAWWASDVDVTVEAYTMPAGLVESSTLSLVLQVMPNDADVSGRDAEDQIVEIYNTVFDTVRANAHVVDPSGVWDLRFTLAGYSFAAARSPQDPFGWAARFEVRIQVEATRCG